MYNSPGRFVSMTGRDIPQDLYFKILDFDEEIFSADADEYEGDTTMPRDTLMSFLQKNILTTSIVYDKQEEKVVGYFQAFPLEENFLAKYIAGEATFKDMNASHVLDYDGEKPLSLYVWSTGISKEYRDKEIQDFGGEPHGEKLYKHMIGTLQSLLLKLQNRVQTLITSIVKA